MDSPAWAEIPDAQRRYHLTVFLQARGYHHPTFALENDVTYVNPGTKTEVSSIEVHGDPPDFHIDMKRGIVGESLTPALLDELEKWAFYRLQTIGYACPRVLVSADADTGRIILNLYPGSIQNIASISEDFIEDTRPGIFRRYDAFRFGHPFDVNLLRLTRNRALSDGQVESFELVVQECVGDQVQLKQETIAGPPRILSFAFGVNTEGLLLARGSWKSTRLGSTASTIHTQALFSARRQKIEGASDWYFLPWPSRAFLRPAVFVERQNETPFEALTLHAQLYPVTTWDGQSEGLIVHAGPVYDYVHTLRGTGPSDVRVLSLEGGLRLMSHLFELYRNDPRTGFLLEFGFNLSSNQIVSDLGALRSRLGFQILWNTQSYDPPLFVVGVRGALATTFPFNSEAKFALPASFLQFLGGAADLRGFSRRELPLGGVGRLTSAYLGVEGRWIAGLPLGIQPIVFADVGALGSDAGSLDDPVFWSPGLGMRVASPIGIFRLTLAHGFETGARRSGTSHLQFYLSYGEEF